MQSAILDRYAAPAPRYTSYPTAPHFSDAVGEDDYREWLRETRRDQGLSLYLHVPFCETLCWYCGCQTKQVRRYDPIPPYLEALGAEMRLVSQGLRARPRVTAVHFGGGSPTILKPEDVTALAKQLRTAFDLAPDVEVALEIDPRGLSGEKLDAWLDAGLTRASIGVQDVSEHVQRAINRFQTPCVTRGVIARLREAGVASISVDLVYGLPRQTLDDVRRTIEAVVGFDVDRVALFGYAHVPWAKPHQRMIDEATLPGVPVRFAQAELAADLLVKAGFRRIGLDHFAREGDAMSTASSEGTLTRNFQGYTVDGADALIGLGASAIGRLPQGYAQNEKGTGRYVSRVREGRLPVARGHRLSMADRARAYVIERLMCDLAFDATELRALFGSAADPIVDEALALTAREESGFFILDGTTFRVPEAGRPFVRSIAANFDAYRDRAVARHSAGV